MVRGFPSMIEHSFCHIPLISRRTERHLWTSGVETWNDCRRMPDAVIDSTRRQSLLDELPRSEAARAAGDLRYFAGAIPQAEHWRLFGEFRRRAVYLDIETTGLGRGDHITTIVTYDGSTIRHFVYGQTLHLFPEYIRDVDFLVTYNGRCFDVPWIERFFGVRFDAVHLDLRYVLKSIGITGGLKRCEQQVGLGRAGLSDVDGFFAVLLWQEYQRRGSVRALETLLAYNVLDVIHLEPLMITAYNRRLFETPFRERCAIPMPAVPPVNPFSPDLALIDRLRGMVGGFRRS